MVRWPITSKSTKGSAPFQLPFHNRTVAKMTAFAEAPSCVRFPARYGDAVSGLRLRVFDPTENELPGWVDSTDIGQHLRAVVTWGALVVPVELSRKWGVSVDELVATATERVVELACERDTIERDQAAIEVTLGHHWTSSLITRVNEVPGGPEGTIVAIPCSDVMMTAPVVGALTIDSLELIMDLCHELYDPADNGITPHVWWSWNHSLWRLTDRQPDGSVDFHPAANVAAFYLVEAIEHLVDPCDECGRTRSL